MPRHRPKRSILIAAFTLVSIFFALSALFDEKPTETKKLDYNKRVFTDEDAILCPQVLLLNPRADHGEQALFELFTSILHREEKAAALGCEVWRGGIPVVAQRMGVPFDSYVAVRSVLSPGVSLFTMEGDLTNGDPEEEKSLSKSESQTEEERAQETASARQREIVETAPNTETLLRESYEADRTEFQRQLPHLEKPAPNLRWYPQSGSGPDNHESSLLVMPSGPCILLTGNTRAGFGLTKLSVDQSGVSGQNALLGPYRDRSSARWAAVTSCSRRLEDGRGQPVNASSKWFTPDDAATKGLDGVENSSIDTVRKTAPHESSSSTSDLAEGSVTAYQPAAGEPPSPIVRVSPTTMPANLHWQQLSNGDQVLLGRPGICAAVSFGSVTNNQIRIKFQDGTTQLFSGTDRQLALDTAAEHCKFVGQRRYSGAP
jgi:hypothetical protein